MNWELLRTIWDSSKGTVFSLVVTIILMTAWALTVHAKFEEHLKEGKTQTRLLLRICVSVAKTPKDEITCYQMLGDQ